MSGLRAELIAQLARFDEDAFIALANRGLLRRAQKDLEKQAIDIVEDTPLQLAVAFGGHTIRFDARGPAHAQCTCPAAGICQHVLAAAIGLQRMVPGNDALANDAPDGVGMVNDPTVDSNPVDDGPANDVPDGVGMVNDPTVDSNPVDDGPANDVPDGGGVDTVPLPDPDSLKLAPDLSFPRRRESKFPCAVRDTKWDSRLRGNDKSGANLTASQPDSADAQPEGQGGALAQLSAALLAIPDADLLKHAGRPGYRWAWQFVQDLDPVQDLVLGGERNIVIGFRHPRVTMRYMGGGVGSLVADIDNIHLARQQVAAVLAYRRAHGIESAAPEAPAPQSGALDLGQDHAQAVPQREEQRHSRARLRAAVLELAEDCVELGLSHLSAGMQERCATLAVWAQGAEYYRLALLLRRIADHVEALLERAGDADERRLLDELSLACALATALGAAAASGRQPQQLLGRARSRYEDSGGMELLGLGAHAWHTPSGYVGLTMLFWSVQDRSFYSHTDARPALQRGFDPVARYHAPGPWSGLSSPATASGRLLRLAGARTNEQGRLSSVDSASANVETIHDFARRLNVCALWSDIAAERAQARRSLLAEAQPMRDWLVLKPARWGQAVFDATRQTLTWPIFDDEGAQLDLELVYSKHASHAIQRIEQLCADGIAPGTLLVVRMRDTGDGLKGEPLSLVSPAPAAQHKPVDALHFDAAPESGTPSRWIGKFRTDGSPAQDDRVMAGDARSDALSEFQHWLRRQAERGTPAHRGVALRREFDAWSGQLAARGLTFVPAAGAGDRALAGAVIRANYACMQFERLAGDTPSDLLDARD
ncbi:MAG: hypothetical protein V4724_40610 [Pseudomonadota bacterium]